MDDFIMRIFLYFCLTNPNTISLSGFLMYYFNLYLFRKHLIKVQNNMVKPWLSFGLLYKIVGEYFSHFSKQMSFILCGKTPQNKF